jgi:Zn-dependent peptidase ImmA (M78 family)
VREVERKIDIMGVIYTVKEVDTVNKTDPRKGEIDYLTNEIRIDKNMPPSSKEQTLMHEILHAVFDLLGMDELAGNEAAVQSIATALHQVFTAQTIF